MWGFESVLLFEFRRPDVSGALSLREDDFVGRDRHTECTQAPMSGDTLFNAQARLCLPADLSIDSLQEQLEQIADDLIVEIGLVENTR